MNSEIIKKIDEKKIIVIVRGVEKNKLIPLAEAMYKGGIRFLEITYSADKKVSDEETTENIKMLSEHFGGRMYIGAGTVLTEEQVALTKKAGGQFIISPDTVPEVIRKTKELGMISIPGAVTPSEITTAVKSGADFVKLFPANNLGAAYIKAITAPLCNVKLLAVGGIDENNMPEYLKAGVCGFGIGGNIVKKQLIDAGDFAAIEKLAEKYVLQAGNEQ